MLRSRSVDMYRFIISRKTLLLLAAIWLVSGLLLFVAGWLLGRHEASPIIDGESLTQVLDATTPARTEAARSAPTTTSQRRSTTPWQRRSSSTSASPSTAASSSGAADAGASSPTASAATSSGSPAASEPSSSPASAPDASSPGAGSSTAGSSTTGSTAAATPAGGSTEDESTGNGAASGADAATNTAASAGSSSAADHSSTDGAFQAGSLSLQIGAYSSEENAEAKVSEVTAKGLAPYIVPVLGEDDKVLYTVRVGRYDSRAAALEAVEELRNSQDISAVIRGVSPNGAGSEAVASDATADSGA